MPPWRPTAGFTGNTAWKSRNLCSATVMPWRNCRPAFWPSPAQNCSAMQKSSLTGAGRKFCSEIMLSGTGPLTKERTQDFVLSRPVPGMPLIPITCQKPCGITGIRKNGRNGFRLEKWILSSFTKPMMSRSFSHGRPHIYGNSL